MRQRGVDAAGQAEHDALEAVLLDVIAQAQHQRGVDLGLYRRQQLGDGRRWGPDAAEFPGAGKEGRIATRRSERRAAGRWPRRAGARRAAASRSTSQIEQLLAELPRARIGLARVVDDAGVARRRPVHPGRHQRAERDARQVVAGTLANMRSRSAPLRGV